MKRFSAWVIVGICMILTVLALTSQDVLSALSQPGTGDFPTFGAALDLVIAMPISWLPLVADYNRFARRSSGAFAGTFMGYLIANVWLYALGALLMLGGGGGSQPGGHSRRSPRPRRRHGGRSAVPGGAAGGRDR